VRLLLLGLGDAYLEHAVVEAGLDRFGSTPSGRVSVRVNEPDERSTR
jgi:hypothetical protein